VLVDLSRGAVLLRARHRVDASPHTKAAKALYGAAIQGCELALDARRDAEQ